MTAPKERLLPGTNGPSQSPPQTQPEDKSTGGARSEDAQSTADPEDVRENAEPESQSAPEDTAQRETVDDVITRLDLPPEAVIMSPEGKIIDFRPDSNGLTALHLAAQKEDSSSMKTLLKFVKEDRKTALIEMKADYVSLWYLYFDYYYQDYHRDSSSPYFYHSRATALFIAAEEGKVEMVEILLKEGANIRASTHGGRRGSLPDMTPLLVASRSGHNGVVKSLLEHERLSDEEPIKVFDQKGQAQVTMPSEVHGIVFWQDKFGHTALHLAAQNRHSHVMKTLLDFVKEFGGQIKKDLLERTTKDGATALFIAAEGGEVEMVEILLKEGANIGASTHDGRRSAPPGMTPLLVASRDGHDGVVESLLKHERSRQKAIMGSKKLGVVGQSIDFFDLIIKRQSIMQFDSIILWQDNDGHTALHLAAQKGRFDVVKTLLDFVKEFGGKIEKELLERKNKDGRTALELARHTREVPAPSQEEPDLLEDVINMLEAVEEEP